MRSLIKTFKNGDEVKILILHNRPVEVNCTVFAKNGKDYLLQTVRGMKETYYYVSGHYLSYCNSDEIDKESKYTDSTQFLPELNEQVIVKSGDRYNISELHIKKGYAPSITFNNGNGDIKINGVITWELLWDNKSVLSNYKKWIPIPKEV